MKTLTQPRRRPVSCGGDGFLRLARLALGAWGGLPLPLATIGTPRPGPLPCRRTARGGQGIDGPPCIPGAQPGGGVAQPPLGGPADPRRRCLAPPAPDAGRVS